MSLPASSLCLSICGLLAGPSAAQTATGDGCPGFAGFVPGVQLRSGVEPGLPVVLDLSGPPATPALFLASASTSSWLGSSLPLDLGLLDPGLVGCTLYQAPNFILPVALDALGTAELTLSGWPADVTGAFQLWSLDASPLSGGSLGGLSPGYTQVACEEAGPLFDGEVILAGQDPVHLVEADFDSDGRMDLAVANRSSDSGNVTVLLGSGGVEFQLGGTFAVFPNVNALEAADFDLDGHVDLVTSNRCTQGPLGCTFGNVTALWGRGDGTFEPAVVLSNAGIYNSDLAVVDIQLDGLPDLVVSNQNSGDLSTLLNLGSRSFAGAGTIPVAPQLRQVEAADLDGDGNQDLVVSAFSGGVWTLAGTPGTSFAAPVPLAGSASYGSFVLADLDGDGAPDLLGNSTGGAHPVLLNSGAGDFSPAQALPAVGVFDKLFVGDLDGDGHHDVAVRGRKPAGNSTIYELYSNDGFGGFEFRERLKPQVSPDGGEDVLLRDLTGDGVPEFIQATPGYGGVALIESACDGGWALDFPVRKGVGRGPMALVARDFDGDGWEDLAVANSIAPPGSAPEALTLLRGGPGISFVQAVSKSLAFGPTELLAGDLDADGEFDLLAFDEESGRMQVAFGLPGVLDFTAPTSQVFLGGGLRGGDLGDLNGDGWLDLAIAAFDTGSAVVALGTGSRATPFGAPVSFPAGEGPTDVALGDFDGDGLLDLAASNGFSDVVRVLIGQGGGVFSGDAPYGYVEDGEPEDLAVADVDGDGALDLVVAHAGRDRIEVLYGAGDGTFLDRASMPTGARPTQVIVADLNLDGRPDVASVDAYGRSCSIGLGAEGRALEPATRHAFFPTAVTPPLISSSGLASADFDRDGAPDLAQCTSDLTIVGALGALTGFVSVLRNLRLE